MAEKTIKKFEDFEKDYYGTTGYHQDYVTGMFYTDGVQAFINEYDAYWVIIQFLVMCGDKVKKCEHCFPRIEVKEHQVTGFLGEVDDDKEPIFKVTDVANCLPDGTLSFEKADNVLALMSEH